MTEDRSTPPGPDAAAAVAAVRAGDLEALTQALDADPALADLPVRGHGGRTLLHIATDWPGFLPRGPEVVGLLVARGADPDRRCGRGAGETPLHWAASSDDADVAAALIEAGADVEAPDGSIGTPLDNAVGYACWAVARLLVHHGATVERLWQAAALGSTDRLEELLAGDASTEEISQAFWHACAGSQRRAAERLLLAGADLHWIPPYDARSALEAASGRSTQQENLVAFLKARGASPASSGGSNATDEPGH